MTYNCQSFNTPIETNLKLNYLKNVVIFGVEAGAAIMMRPGAGAAKQEGGEGSSLEIGTGYRYILVSRPDAELLAELVCLLGVVLQAVQDLLLGRLLLVLHPAHQPPQ